MGRLPQHHFGIERVSDAGRHLQHDHAEVADVFQIASCVVAMRRSAPHGPDRPLHALLPQFGRELVAMGNHPSIVDFLSRVVESGLMSGCVRREFAKR